MNSKMKKLIFLALLVSCLSFGQSYVPLPTNIQIKNIPAYTNNALSWMNTHKMTNPMTAPGDMIVGDTGGVPIRLGASVGYLYWNGTNYVWNTPGTPTITPIGPNIQSITFPKLNWTTVDGSIQFSLTFDKPVSWTGTPGIYMSIGTLTTTIAFTNTQSPAQTLVFGIYPPIVLGNSSPAFGIYQLSWGNRSTAATLLNSYTADTGNYGTASILFTAQNYGAAGNAITVSIGNVLQYNFSGATPIPNTPFSLVVTGNNIVIIGATDGSGNELTTGNDLIAAYNASSEMQALVNMQVTMADTSKPIEFTNANVYCPSTPCQPMVQNLNSGYDDHDGTQIDSVPGYTAPTFTYADASGSPNVTFSGPDTTQITYQTIVTSFAQFYGDVYPQTGTAGTDFNITSNQIANSSQLLFNLPTASATKRGALSSADWSAFNAKESTSNKGVANGYAGLDSSGKVPTGQLPSISAPASGVAVPLTAGGTIAKGTVVSFASDNTVSQGLNIAYGPLQPIGTTSITINQYGIAAQGSNFVLVYNDTNNATKVTAIAATQSGTPMATTTFGTPVLVPTVSSGTTAAVVPSALQYVASLSPTTFAVVFRDSTASNKIYAIVGSTSGNAITFGTPVLVPSSSGAGSTNASYTIQPLSSTSFLVAIVDSTNGNNLAISAATVTGTAISFGALVNPTVTYQLLFGNFPLLTLSPTSFILFTGNNSFGDYAVAGSVSGNTVTFGTNVQLVANGFSSMGTQSLGSAGFVVQYYNATLTPNRVAARVGLVSIGNVITLGTEAAIPTTGGKMLTTPPTYQIQSLDSSHFAVMYQDNFNTLRQTVVVGTIANDGTITYGSLIPVSSGSVSSTYNLLMLDSTHLLFRFLDTTQTNTWQMVVGTVSGSSVHFGTKMPFDYPNTATAVTVFVPALSATQFVYTDGSYNFGVGSSTGLGPMVGVAMTNASAASPVSVAVSGLAANTFSGLTPGAEYYALGDGTLTTVPNGIPVGVALSTTDMLLRK
jgi:hypothetical protein